MKKVENLLTAMLSAAVLVSLFAISVSAAGEEVEINSTNFPDAIFRQYVSDECDTNGDGKLSSSEISNVTNIGVDSRGISDLTGVNYFTNAAGQEAPTS